jgi:lysozyme
MKTSQIGVDLIKHFEGFISKPYLCPAGVASIGYGSTKYVDGKKVKLNDKAINENESTLLLKNTLTVYENIVNKKVKVQLKQSQFDALVSHTYNTGGSDTLFNLINNEANAESIKKWFETKYISANGKVLKGLVERRKAESKLYFHEK